MIAPVTSAGVFKVNVHDNTQECIHFSLLSIAGERKKRAVAEVVMRGNSALLQKHKRLMLLREPMRLPKTICGVIAEIGKLRVPSAHPATLAV